ncbi:MAG: PQQ-binding-like beta-propeller repeat protein [Planctomycetes bacterium]|nr:PQQ-binding-like beta-propeller repeat protein [Planctomycetota bacterium]
MHFNAWTRWTLLLSLALGLLVSTAAIFGAETSDFRWVFPVPEELRPLADGIEQSRREGRLPAVEEGVLRFVEVLVRSVPDGAFPLSDDHWVGSAQYLSEILELLEPRVRDPLIEKIDLVLGARLEARATPEERSISSGLRRRLHRDFRYSRFAEDALMRRAARLLEQGEVAGYVTLLGSRLPASKRDDLLRMDQTEPPETIAISPGACLGAVPLAPWSGHADSPAPTSISKPGQTMGRFGTVPAIRLATVDDRSVYWAGDEDLRALDPTTGQPKWRAPFFDSGGTSLPGAIRRPASTAGVVGVVSSSKALGFDAETGERLWEFPLRRLFPLAPRPTPVPDESGTPTDSEEPKPPLPERDDRDLIASSPLLAAGDSFVAVVSILRGGYLETCAAQWDADGKLAWARPLGSAAGATYLALGSAAPQIAVDGETLFALPQRGVIVALDLTDGAFTWARAYPSFDAEGSRDSNVTSDRLRQPLLYADGTKVIAAPLDATSVFLWNRDGALRRRLPIPGSHWVTLETERDQDAWTLLIARDHALSQIAWNGTEWTSHGTTLPDRSPSVTGAPVRVRNEWWIPHRSGFYRWQPTGQSDAPTSVRLAIDQAARTIVPDRNGLWIDDGNRPYWVAPIADSDEESALTAALIELRRVVGSGDLARAETELDALGPRLLESSGLRRSGEIEFQLRSLAALDLLDALRSLDSTPLEPTRAHALRLGAIALIPHPNERAIAAYREAVDAGRRGENEHARALAYAALDAAPTATLPVTTDVEAPCELAVRRLLDVLDPPSADSAVWLARERRAHTELAEAIELDNLDRLRLISERHPGTPSGRQASIEHARGYYVRGSRAQALWALRRLVLLEPETPEAVRARFEIATIEAEEARPRAAKLQLEVLRDRYGHLESSSLRGSETVAERASRQLTTLRIDDGVPDRPEPSLAVDFQPVWRTRTELLHQTKVHVTPVPTLPDAFVTTSQRQLALHDARTGAVRWTRTIDRPSQDIRLDRPRWADELGYFAPPIFVGTDIIVVTDHHHLYGIDFTSGALQWSVSLDESEAEPDDDPTLRTRVELSTASAGVCVLTASDGLFHAYDVRTGTKLWQERVPGPLVGAPEVVGDLIVVAYHVPAEAEIRDLRNGRVLRRVPRGTDDAPASDRNAPWISRDGVVSVPAEREVHAIDIESGAELWSTPLGGVLGKVHRFRDLPFFVAEVDQPSRGITLLGIAERTGQLLWRRPIGTRSIHSLDYYDGQLYVVEAASVSYRALCLDIPRAFRRDEGLDLLPVAELDVAWTQSLGKHWDSFSILPYREWLLVQAEFQSSLSVLHRDTGLTLRAGPFRLAEEFLTERRRLFHAGFYDDTLVLVTQQGSIGLRRRTPFETTRDQWRALSNIDPLSDRELDADALLQLSAAAYEDGRVEESCRVLEDALQRPALPLSDRRRLTSQLEGFAQHRGEYSRPEWKVARISRAPRVDGELDEPWNAQTGVRLDNARFYHPIQGPREDAASWRGWRDLSVTLFTAWSDTGFHLALDVVDDSIHPYDGDADRWQGDCLFMAFDFRGDGGLRPQRDDQLLTLALTVPKPAPPPPLPGENGEDPPPEDDEEDEANRPAGEFQVHRKPDGSGVIYEVTIPWETFRDARREPHFPFPGAEFGLNVLLTDDDTGTGARTYLSLPPGQMLQETSGSIWDVFSPEYFPRLRIGD